MPEIIDIRGENGKGGLLCQIRIEGQKDEIEISIGRKDKYALVTVLEGVLSVKYLSENPFRIGLSQHQAFPCVPS